LTQNIAIEDKSWVHHYDPENKRQSMECCHSGSPSVKKFKTLPSAKKVMLTIFWDASGVLYTEFLTKGSMVNSDRYCATLLSLKKRIRRIRPERNTFISHHDTTAPHCCAQTQDAMTSLKLTVVPHPPYSPDLALSEFWLFPKKKEMLKGQHFSFKLRQLDAKESAANQKLSSWTDMNKRTERLKKCAAVNGECVEK
jgi:histone-lysine N-methyltransferase SETMAR